MITIHQDLDAIASILYQTFEITPFKRNYDAAFGQIVKILHRYGITENPRNLRFRFTLCMQEFFDSIPQHQWKIEDPAFIKQSEEFAITKFKDWIIEQITYFSFKPVMQKQEAKNAQKELVSKIIPDLGEIAGKNREKKSRAEIFVGDRGA